MALRFNGMWKPHNYLFIIMYSKPHNYLFIIIKWKPHNHILSMNHVITLSNIMAANYDTWDLCLTISTAHYSNNINFDIQPVHKIMKCSDEKFFDY